MLPGGVRSPDSTWSSVSPVVTPLSVGGARIPRAEPPLCPPSHAIVPIGMTASPGIAFELQQMSANAAGKAVVRRRSGEIATIGEDALWCQTAGTVPHAGLTSGVFLRASLQHQLRCWRFAAVQSLTALPLMLAATLVFSFWRKAYVASGGDPAVAVEPSVQLAAVDTADRLPYLLLTLVMCWGMSWVGYVWLAATAEHVGGRWNRRARAIAAVNYLALAAIQVVQVIQPYRGIIASILVANTVCIVGAAAAVAPGTPLWKHVARMLGFHTLGTAALSYSLIGLFYGRDTTEGQRILIRLVGLPLCSEFALAPVRAMGRAFFAKGTARTDPVFIYTWFTIIMYSTVARLMAATMATTWGTVVVVVGASAQEILLRTSLSTRDIWYNCPRMGLAKARAFIRTPSSRLVLAELLVIDQLSELVAIPVAFLIVVANGLTPQTWGDVGSALLSMVLQFAAEAATDMIPTLVALRWSPQLTGAPSGARGLQQLALRAQRNALNTFNTFKQRVAEGGLWWWVTVVVMHTSVATLSTYLVLLPSERLCSQDAEGWVQEQEPCEF